MSPRARLGQRLVFLGRRSLWLINLWGLVDLMALMKFMVCVTYQQLESGIGGTWSLGPKEAIDATYVMSNLK